MYSSSPESLDEILHSLETLREQMVKNAESVTNGFSEFLAAKGYGPMSLTHIARSEGITDINDIYNLVANSWREYLSHQQRSF